MNIFKKLIKLVKDNPKVVSAVVGAVIGGKAGSVLSKGAIVIEDLEKRKR